MVYKPGFRQSVQTLAYCSTVHSYIRRQHTILRWKKDTLVMEKFVIGLLLMSVYVNGQISTVTPAQQLNVTQTSEGRVTPDGKCVCIVQTPSLACSESANYAKLTQVSATVASISAEVSSYELVSLRATLESLSVKVAAFEATFSKQSVAVSVSQLASLRADITSVHALVVSVSANGTASVKMDKIKAELLAITASLNSIRAQSPIARNKDLQAKVDSLNARLANCKEGVSTNHTFSRFIGDSMPLTKTLKNDRCHNLKTIHIGEPFTHFWHGTAIGSWFKDPLPKKESDIKKIFVLPGTTSGNERIQTYKNYSDLALKATPHYSAYFGYRYGTGSIMYNGFLYFHDQYPQLKKFDIDANKVVKTVTFPAATTPYLNGGYIYIDLHVDETGMYAVYKGKTHEKHLMISKINPYDLTITKTWNTGKAKESIRSVFMVCGRLYAIDNHHRLYKNGNGVDYYVFDTNTSKADRISIQVIQKYGSLSQINYNPREKALIGWDNGHLMTYPVTFYYNQSPASTTRPTPVPSNK